MGRSDCDDRNKLLLKKLLQQTESLKKNSPKFDRAMGVRDGKATDLKIHIRGNYLTLGEQVKRALPEVFDFQKLSIPGGSSGRLQLANWLTDHRHPLTARVMANRVWLWHFGTGIVTTPDNFGRLGARPSHPQLLGLACQSISGAWLVDQKITSRDHVVLGLPNE